jgi:hypothetical protein
MGKPNKGHANIKPIQKGEVRNPKGRPVGSVNSKTVIKKLLEMGAVKIDPKTKRVIDIKGLDGKKINFAEAIFTAILNKAVKGDVVAANALFDRLEGKPKQTTDVNVPNGSVVLIGGQKVNDE